MNTFKHAPNLFCKRHNQLTRHNLCNPFAVQWYKSEMDFFIACTTLGIQTSSEDLNHVESALPSTSSGRCQIVSVEAGEGVRLHLKGINIFTTKIGKSKGEAGERKFEDCLFLDGRTERYCDKEERRGRGLRWERAPPAIYRHRRTGAEPRKRRIIISERQEIGL